MTRMIIFSVIAAAVIWAAYLYAGKSGVATPNPAGGSLAAAPSSGLKTEDLVVGSGPRAENGDKLTVNYVGTLDNGTKFDSSYDRSRPFEFILGTGEVIKGWDLGLLGIRVGGKRNLTIPPDLGYGNRGAGPIPPDSTLHFTVELLAVASSSTK